MIMLMNYLKSTLKKKWKVALLLVLKHTEALIKKKYLTIYLFFRILSQELSQKPQNNMKE